jgi:hypothetical protein
MKIVIIKKILKNIITIQILLFYEDLLFDTLFDVGFDNEHYNLLEETFEEWTKKSKLEYSITNSIKTVVLDKNITSATVELRKHSFQD